MDHGAGVSREEMMIVIWQRDNEKLIILCACIVEKEKNKTEDNILV